MLPKGRFVEAQKLRQILRTTELPFSRNRCGIAGVLEQMGEGRRIGVNFPEAEIIADIVQPGHDLHSRGRAQWLHVTVLESHPVGCHLIEMWRLVMTAVRRHAFIPKVVCHDQNDVRLSIRQYALGCSDRDDSKCHQYELLHNGNLCGLAVH